MTGHVEGSRSVETSREALSERLFDAGLGMLDTLVVYLGDRLGLYRAMAGHEGMTSADLASRAGIHERYAREWLEHQAAAGILEVDDPAATPDERRFRLPPAHAEVLTDLDSLYSMAPMARSIVACATVMPQLQEAFRTGGGVSKTAYGQDAVEAQGDFNRPWLLQSFGAEHLPGIPEVHARLLADPPAQVADVACGAGWASIAMAKAYARLTVDGFDLDAASIDLARRNAAEAGVADRVRFDVRDAADPAAAGKYDFAVMVEALHDVSQPVAVLAAIRGMLAPGGSLLVIDEKTGERFTAPANPAERLFYGYSVVSCLPEAMTDRPTAGTGTVMRPDTLRRYAREAGYRDVEVLDLGLELMRGYRLIP